MLYSSSIIAAIATMGWVEDSKSLLGDEMNADCVHTFARKLMEHCGSSVAVLVAGFRSR
jgi:hypothetical protein